MANISCKLRVIKAIKVFENILFFRAWGIQMNVIFHEVKLKAKDKMVCNKESTVSTHEYTYYLLKN